MTEKKNMFLHKDISSLWSIRNKHNQTLFSFVAGSEREAIERAKAWASSWSEIEVIYVNREDQKRD
jgi:hypothetical protein